MIEFFSKIEVVGQVIKQSNTNDYDKPYYYIRLMYKDSGSPMKFINVYCWDCKDQAINLNLEKGDIIHVSGELSYTDKDDKPLYMIRSKEVSLIERTSTKKERLSF